MRSIRLFLIGMVMGMANLIPGISGGTVALVTGVYFECLECVKSLSLRNLKSIPWQFMASLGLGMGVALLWGARLIAYLLFQPLYSSILRALFMGLILGSVYFCLKSIAPSFRQIKRSSYVSLFLGAGISFFLCGLNAHQVQATPFVLALIGFLAACAWLLPGMSGSLVLVVGGVYTAVISALVSLSSGFNEGYFDRKALSLLLFLALGIAFGVICFSHLASYLMKKVPSGTMAFLSGAMLGGLRSVIPDLRSPLLVIMSVFFGLVLSISFRLSLKGYRAS